MGITIHYSGKAKSPEAVDQLIDTLQEISEESGWSYHLVNGSVKGHFKPFWGIGYGFKPSEDQILKGGIEFFPRMVSSQCNGYFKIYDTKFAAPVKKSFEKGVWPSFTIDTRKKGIQLTLHPKCETLSFIFIFKRLNLGTMKSMRTAEASSTDSTAFPARRSLPGLMCTASYASSLRWRRGISITPRCTMKASITRLKTAMPHKRALSR